MKTLERRRDRRLPVRFRAVLRRCAVWAVIEDASFHGMRLQMDAPLVLGQLHCLEVCATDDDGDVFVRVNFVPVRREPSADGYRYGARILGTEPGWERIVAGLQAASRRPPASAPTLIPPVRGHVFEEPPMLRVAGGRR